MAGEAKLGELLEVVSGQQRDAVHVAVVPVVSKFTLKPGQHIGIPDLTEPDYVGPCGNNIGIVDPFLEHEALLPGMKFLMCLYPGTTTGMRHAWKHPTYDSIALLRRENYERLRTAIGNAGDG